MIPNYTKPQSRFFPVFLNTTVPALNTRFPVVVGPQYRLFRFGKEATVDSITGHAYAAQAADQSLAFRFLDSAGAIITKAVAEVVDPASVRVTGTNLEAELALILPGDGQPVAVSSVSTSHILQSTVTGNFVGTGLHTLLHGASVAVGDVAVVTTGSVVKRRTVVGFLGKQIASTFGTDTESDDSILLGAPTNPTTSTLATAFLAGPLGAVSGDLVVAAPDGFKGNLVGAYTATGTYGETFTLTVTTTGVIGGAQAVVAVTSLSGKYLGSITSTQSAGTFVFTDASTNGATMAGLVATIDTSNLIVPDQLTIEDVFTFRTTGAYTRFTTGNPASSSIVKVASGSSYVGAQDTTLIFEVITGTYHATTPTATGAVVRVTDSAGLYGAYDVTITDGVAFTITSTGMGVIFDLATSGATPQRGMRKGDRYYVNCVATHNSTTAFDRIVLDGPAVDTAAYASYGSNVQTSIRRKFTGDIAITDAASGVAWTLVGQNVVLNSPAALYMSGRNVGYTWVPFVDGAGKLHVSWRALVKPVVGAGPKEVSSDANIIANFGTIDPDNDIAYGLHLQLLGLGGTGYGLSVDSESSTDYATALAKLERIAYISYITTLTETTAVRDALKAHVLLCNGPTRKAFREGFVGVSSPGERVVLTTHAGLPLVATITSFSGANTLVTITNVGADITGLALSAGDIVRVGNTDYPIASVMSANEIVLSSGPASPINPAVAVSLVKADTVPNTMSYVSGVATSLGNRALRVIWGEGVRDPDGLEIKPKFQAAYYIGLRAGTVTQKPLTRTSLSFAASAVPMYTRYTETDLDTIAAGGVTIVAQDAEGASIYIRHELTTDTSLGALSYEGMVVSNVFRISRRLSAIDESFIGVRNLTQDTINDLRDEWIAVLNSETQTDAASDVGPAVIRFTTPVVTVDPTLKDRARISSTITHPLPFNHIDGYLVVDQDSELSISGAVATIQ